MRVRLILDLDHDELAQIVFGADLHVRSGVAQIRTAVTERILAFGLRGCRQRYRLIVADAMDDDTLRQHFELYDWYRAAVVRAYPIRASRSRRAAALGRPLLDILADDA